MIGYIVRRLLFALSMVWGVSFGTFCAFGLSFDPLWQFNIGGSQAIREKRELAAQFHLNAPILERYWLWLGELVRHGFVRWDNQPLNSPLLHAASVTAQLLAVSLVLVGVFSVLFGTITARLAGTPLDWLLRTLGYVAWAIPPSSSRLCSCAASRVRAGSMSDMPTEVSAVGSAGSRFPRLRSRSVLSASTAATSARRC
jgi:ABC-type dipeptide/oligopeptide/nickel transport system permease component